MTCRYPHVDCLRVTGPLGIYPPVYIPARVAPVFVTTHIRQTNKLWVQKKNGFCRRNPAIQKCFLLC